jgi:hypothetical protein
MGKPSFSLWIKIFLRATMAPERLERALETIPKVPSPSFWTISKSSMPAHPRNRRWLESVVAIFDVFSRLSWLAKGARECRGLPTRRACLSSGIRRRETSAEGDVGWVMGERRKSCRSQTTTQVKGVMAVSTRARQRSRRLPRNPYCRAKESIIHSHRRRRRRRRRRLYRPSPLTYASGSPAHSSTRPGAPF